MTEQNKFKRLCLDSSPQRWSELRGSLRQYKLFPIEESQNMLTLNTFSVYSLEELKHLNKQCKNNIFKNSKLLKYQSRTIQSEPNPMPKGYRIALIERKINEWEKEIIDIEARILQLEKTNKLLERGVKHV